MELSRSWSPDRDSEEEEQEEIYRAICTHKYIFKHRKTV